MKGQSMRLAGSRRLRGHGRKGSVEGHSKRGLTLAVAAMLATPAAVYAQSYTWVMIPPQSARNWSEGWNVDPAGSPPYPQTPGAAVLFLSQTAGLGNSSLTLDVPDAVVGSLTLGRQLGPGTLLLQSLAPDNTNTLTFSNPLTGVSQLSTFFNSIGTVNVTAPVALASNVQRFEVNNSGFAGFQISGPLNATHPSAVLSVRHSNAPNTNGPANFNLQQPSGFAAIEVAPIVNWASIGTLAVNSPLTLRNANVSSSVNSNIRGTFIRTNFTGTAPLTVDNVGPLAQVQVTGSGSYAGTLTVSGGTFALNHNSINVGGNNAAKVAATAGVQLHAATFALLGSGSSATSASVGGAALLSGQSTLSISRAGSQTASLTLGTLSRNPQTSLYVVRNNSAATASVTTFGSGIAPASGLLGPWAILSNASNNSGQWDFISNTASLAPATYVAFPAGSGTGTENVSTGSNVTTSGASIHSLRVTGNVTLTLNGNLSLTSGGVLLAAPNFGSANLTIAGSGALSSASGELYIHQPPSPQGTFPTLTASAPVQLGSGALVKTGGGVLNITTLNTSPGARLLVQGGTYRGPLPSNLAVSLSGGGSLDTNGAASLNVQLGSGSGEVNWGRGGGGFSASGAPAVVSLNGGAPLSAAQLNRHLTLQTSTSNQPLTFVNPLDLTGDLSIAVGAFGGNAANGRSWARLAGGLSGTGSLVVSGSTNGMLVLDTVNVFSGGILLSGGQIWAIEGEGLQRDNPVQLGFGGVWATRGVMDRRLGTELGGTDGGVRWLNEGTISGDAPNVGWGGFAAVGGPLSVALRDRTGGLALLAPFAGGPSSGSPASLHLGSPFSTSPVTVVNHFSTASGAVDLRSFGPVTNVVAGNISGSGTVTIAGGGGSLLLSGDNTNHTGNLAFVSGAGVLLKFASPQSAIGGRSSPGTLTIANNTTFDPNGVDLTTSTTGTFRNVSFSNGSGVAGLGMLINSGSGSVSIGEANIGAPSNLNFGGAGEIRVTGNITGGNALIKRGYGRLVLSGANTQSGVGMLLGGGSVVFDYTTNAAPKFNGPTPANANNSAGNLQLVAVDLILQGGSGSVTQPIPGLQLGQSSGNAPSQSSPSTLRVVAGNGDVAVPITRLVRNDGQGAIDFSLASLGTGTPSVTIGAIPNNGVVTTLTLTNGGSGYTSPPTVSFPGLDALTVAPQAVAVIDDTGSVVQLILTKQGTALDPSAPLTVQFSGGGGSGAAATATVAALPTIGNFATLNKRHFAALSGGSSGTLVAPSYSTPAAGIGNALANIDVPAGVNSVSIPAVGSITNSLRFADGSADTLLNLDGGFLRLNPHAGGVLVTPDVGSRNVTINGNLRWNFNRDLFIYNHSQGTLTFTGALNDVVAGAGLTKVGVGDVVLSGSLAADSLRVAGGRLIVSAHAALPTSSIVLGGGTPELSGTDASGRPVAPTLRYAAAGGTYGGTLTLIGPAVLDLAAAGTLEFTATGNNVTTFNDAPWDFTITGSSSVRFAGPVRIGSSAHVLPGYGVFTQASTGVTTLAGSGNRALGGWVVKSGTLALAHGTDTLQDDNPVTVDGGTLSLLGSSDRFASLTLLGGTIAGPGTYDAGYYDLRSGVVTAILTGTRADLDKSGPGTVSLGGLASPGGFVNVRGGTLVVSSSLSTPRAVSVSSAATLTVTPSAFVSAGSYSQTGGNLNLGSQMNVLGPVTFAGSGLLTIDVLSDTSFGRIVCSGFVDISNFSLDFTGLSNLSGNVPLTLISAVGISGTFGLAQPLPAGFSLVYAASSLTLQPSAPPPPANWVSPADGDWSVGSNWSTGTAPDGIGASAVFDLDASASTINVRLDIPVTLGNLTFDADTSYSLFGTNSLTMRKTAGEAVIQTPSGYHGISATIVPHSNLRVDVGVGAAMTLSLVQGPGGLTRSGTGFLMIGADVQLGGALAIDEGFTVFGGVVSTSGAPLTIAAGATAEFSALPNLPGADPRVILEVGPLAVGGTAGHPGRMVVFGYGAEDNRSAVLQNVVIAAGLSIANNGAPLGNRSYYGFVDLANNDLIVRSSAGGHSATLASLRDMVRFWLSESDGLPGQLGLGSSMAFYGSNGFTTLAVFNNNPLGNGIAALNTFDGVAVSAYDLLVKYTYIGDTNLDGVVDATDLSRALQGLNGGGSGWNFGDVNYDGVIDFGDLGRILAALRGQGGSLGDSSLPPTSPGPVPEPSSLAWLALAIPVLRRRRG